ncbi:hypothetical protein Tco_1295262, partial [Tanacetum coccineum]
MMKLKTVQIILQGLDNDIIPVDACTNACECGKPLKGCYKNEVNEDLELKIAVLANPLAILVLKQQPCLPYQNHPTQKTLKYSSTRSQTVYKKQRKAMLPSSAHTNKLIGGDTDDESDDQEFGMLFIMYMAQLQEVTPDSVDNSGPIFDDDPMHKDDQTNQLMFKDLKKFQAELDKYNDVNYASKVEIDCAKAKGDLMSYKIDFEKKKHLPIMSQAKEAQIKLYKTREDKELDKVIALENKVKVLNDIVYKTGQSVQTMNMLNRNCKTSFAKPEFLKKAQRANPRLYDIVTAQILPQNRLPIVKNTNVGFAPVIPNTRVSRPQLKSNHLEDRVMSNNSQGKKQEVEDHRRKFKFSNNKTSVTACNDSLNAKTSNVNFVCVTCGSVWLNDNHDLCVLHYINGVNSKSRQPMAVPVRTTKPKHNVNKSVATSIGGIPSIHHLDTNGKPSLKKEMLTQTLLVEIILFIVDSGCSKHMTRNLKLLTNFVEKFLGTVKFGNDQIAPILGYRDLVKGTITIKRVYYVKGLNHNLFSVGQLCDADLEVAFRKSTCYIRDLKGNDLLTGYSTQSRAYRVFNKRTRVIVETIHVNFDELPLMTSDHNSSGLAPQCPKMALEQDSLSPVPQSKENVPQIVETETTSNELDLLFSLMFDELFNGSSPVVSKSSAVTDADDARDNRQQQDTTPSTSTTIAADSPPLNIPSTPAP